MEIGFVFFVLSKLVVMSAALCVFSDIYFRTFSEMISAILLQLIDIFDIFEMEPLVVLL